MSRTTIEIELAESAAEDDHNRILTITWTPPSPQRRREIIGRRRRTTLHDAADENQSARDPHRRASRRHHWLDYLNEEPQSNNRSARAREGKTESSIPQKVSSLAFLCPTLVRAAIYGRLPRGFGMQAPDILQWTGRSTGGRELNKFPPRLSASECCASRWDVIRASSQVEIDPPLVSPVPAAPVQPRNREPKIRRRETNCPHSPSKAGRPSRIDPADH